MWTQLCKHANMCRFGSLRVNNSGVYDHNLPIIELERDLMVIYPTAKIEND